MRVRGSLGLLLLSCVWGLACGGAPPPKPLTPEPDEHEEPADAASSESTPEPAMSTLPPAESPPPSTASYEQATSVPESIDVHDEAHHLTDNQLNAPMRTVLDRCRVPANATVTIKTAVQNGHAIGVSVHVDLPTPKKKNKKISKGQARAQAKAVEKLKRCADHAVRALSWPPSRRRDAFTTTF